MLHGLSPNKGGTLNPTRSNGAFHKIEENTTESTIAQTQAVR